MATASASTYAFPQPVPWERIPAAAGVLPAWENKKMELGMATLSTGNDNNDGSIQQQHARGASSGSNLSSSSAGNNVEGGNSNTRPGNPSRPSFFASLRSRSSRSNSMGGGLSRSGSNASFSSPNLGLDSTGGIAGGSTALQNSSSFNSNASSNSKNPFLRYIAKRFSQRDLRNNKSTGLGNGNNTQSGGRGAVMVNQVPQRFGEQHKGRKVRSTAFAEKMKATSGKAVTKLQKTFSRFNSKTPKDQLPKTWEEWRTAYARGDIDITDLPAPPSASRSRSRTNSSGTRSAPGEEGGASQQQEDASPFEAQFFAAPLPENQRERQLAFNRLDIEGKRGQKPSTIAVPEGEEPLPDTLEGHPAFRNIVTQARALFDSSISILTVFNENRQLFLAETGLGGMKEVPREVTFCSHAVLQRPVEPFVLPDTHQDWRFAKSPLVVKYGSRAYYGVPLLAPDFGNSSSTDSQIPIGTLCIIDDKPREAFSAEQRSKMGDLALLAQKTIANWSRARLQARLDDMERSFQAWKNEAGTLGSGVPALGQGQQRMIDGPRKIEEISAGSSAGNNGQSAAEQPQQQAAPKSSPFKQLRKSPSKHNTRVPVPAPTADIPPVPTTTNGASRPTHQRAADSEDMLSMANNDESFVTAPNAPQGTSNTNAANGNSGGQKASNRQKIYDISTRLVGTSLELSLVYILKLEFDPSAPTTGEGEEETGESVKSLSLVSSFGLPTPEPAFDAVLHLKALRSPEGGLLYQNAALEDLQDGERLPESGETDYASALLVPIAEGEHSGYVLAGFTDDPERALERSDLEYLTTIASELAIYLSE